MNGGMKPVIDRVKYSPVVISKTGWAVARQTFSIMRPNEPVFTFVKTYTLYKL
jgi:hypothetical protein